MSDRDLHPLATLFPLMSQAALKELQDDIAMHGLREPILLDDEGRVVDGRNRLYACEKLGIAPRFETINSGESVAAVIWSLNGVRRNLTTGQKATIGVKMLPELEAEARKRQGHGDTAPGKTLSENFQQALVNGGGSGEKARAADDAGKIVGTTGRSVYHAKKLSQAAPDLFARVDSGEITLNAAVEELKSRGATPNTNGNGTKPKSTQRAEPTRARNTHRRTTTVGVTATLESIIGACSGLDRVDLNSLSVSADQAKQWKADLTKVLSTIRRIRNHVRSQING